MLVSHPATTHMKAPSAITLAKHYIELLREDLTPEQIANAVSLNTAEADPNIDHIADVTDTNEVLAAAWEKVTGKALEFDPEDDATLAILNNALELAKKADFLTSKLPSK